MPTVPPAPNRVFTAAPRPRRRVPQPEPQPPVEEKPKARGKTS